jgi:hypothetical protein
MSVVARIGGCEEYAAAVVSALHEKRWALAGLEPTLPVGPLT